MSASEADLSYLFVALHVALAHCTCLTNLSGVLTPFTARAGSSSGSGPSSGAVAAIALPRSLRCCRIAGVGGIFLPSCVELGPSQDVTETGSVVF